MQVFRLMGMPDSVIAFDELPKRLTDGVEMLPATGFPRHWKEWMGKRDKVTHIPPEKDFLTGQVRRFDPIVEKDSFFYVIDWRIRPNEERWKEISDYVRQNVSKDFRIMDRLEDMAKPLAPDKLSAITLEPEEVVVIPLPKETAALVDAGAVPVKTQNEPAYVFKCEEEGCKAEFEKKQALRMHSMRKHQKQAVA